MQKKIYKLLNAYVQCVYVVSAKYQIAPSKALVGFDQPLKALSMHIQKPNKGIIVLVLIAFILSKITFFSQTPSCICSMCLHCIGKVSNCSIKSYRSWSANEGTIYAYTNTLLGKNCLSSHCSHFAKNNFFLNQTLSCICSMCLHCIGKVSNCSIKSCGRSWSAHEGTIYAYTKALLGKNGLVLTVVILSKKKNSEPNSIMHMFNVCTLHWKMIKLSHQKLW